MKAPHNYIFVKVESQYNDEVQISGGKKLYLTTGEFYNDDEGGANYKPTMIRRHYGIVIGVPIKLTDEVKVRQIDPGLPAPGRYIPNEMIAHLKTMNTQVDSWSSLNDFVHQWKTCADYEMEVQEGDKIYFHHNTVTDGNEVPEMGENVYKLEYQNAICVVRDEMLIPVAGNMLIEPIWKEGMEDLGNGKRGKIAESGIVTELHDKPEYLIGKVIATCSPMKGEKIGVMPGDKIIYIIHADWEVEIEGKVYYVMKYWDIMGKIKDGE